MSVDAIEVLIHGTWPLWQLDLSENNLCEEACQHLARGAWPVLVLLGLREYGIDDSGVHQLLQGCWPELEELDLMGTTTLSVAGVYTIGQDIVIRKLVDCKYAGVFANWLEKCDHATEEVARTGDLTGNNLTLWIG